MPRHVCTVCGILTTRRGRCFTHARSGTRSVHNAVYDTRAWRRLRARVLRAWRGEHGDWCPGHGRIGHATADLTVDHVVPLSAGGAPFEVANTHVLCRTCNSSKGGSEADRGSPHAESDASSTRAPHLCARGRVSRKISDAEPGHVRAQAPLSAHVPR